MHESITIGAEEWSFVRHDTHVNIHDEDGDYAFSLRWNASVNEIRAGIYGFGAGFKAGKYVGTETKQAEIRKVLLGE